MAERSLRDWLHHLERLHPKDIDLGLTRISAVGRVLGLVPYTIPVIMVAGTNGKGSVVYASDAMLRALGRRTGRYTSPHLLAYNERMVIDGEPASDAAILSAFEAIDAARGDITLTYFEFATLAALWLFREQAVEVAILEVGLGGRLDACNIVDADVAVITAIDLDHQHWLGDTVDAIAPEKAAIAREGRPVVLAEPDYPGSLFQTLRATGAVPLHAGDSWSWYEDAGRLEVRLAGGRGHLKVPVPKGLRPGNVAAAVQAMACVVSEDIDGGAVARALHDLTVPGRRERRNVLDRELVLDVAHNPAAMTALVEWLQAHPIPGRTFAALGLMSDKDLDAMAAQLALAVDGAWALAIPGIDRAQSPERIWEALDRVGIASPQADFGAETVWARLMEGSDAGDRIVICGSFHTVAGIMTLLPDHA